MKQKDFGQIYDSFIHRVLKKKFMIESLDNASGYITVVKVSDIVAENNKLVESVIRELKKKIKKKKPVKKRKK